MFRGVATPSGGWLESGNLAIVSGSSDPERRLVRVCNSAIVSDGGDPEGRLGLALARFLGFSF